VRLVCVRCHAADRDADVEGPDEWACTRCGGSLTPEITRFGCWDEAVRDLPGVGRYAPLLPVSRQEELISSETALRPLDSPRLAEVLNVESFMMLPQTHNRTGTFKDNEAVLLAAKCKEWGLGSVCMHSSGNTARAYQYYLDRAGIECTSFVPQASADKCPTTTLGRSGIVAVPGNMVSAADAAIAHSKETGARRLTPSQWKIEGKAPVGLALAERCPNTTLIAVTVASGYGPLGMERGIRRARSAGLASVGPHTYRLFQAADAGVLGQAIREGRDEIDLGTMVAPEQAFEPTLQSTNPNRTLPLVQRLIQETGSRIDSVSPELVESAADMFAAACGDLGIPIEYSQEKSAFICWAGLVGAAKAGELGRGERVTMIVSGSAPRAQLP
jgi:hypothetical protein